MSSPRGQWTCWEPVAICSCCLGDHSRPPDRSTAQRVRRAGARAQASVPPGAATRPGSAAMAAEQQGIAIPTPNPVTDAAAGDTERDQHAPLVKVAQVSALQRAGDWYRRWSSADDAHRGHGQFDAGRCDVSADSARSASGSGKVITPMGALTSVSNRATASVGGKARDEQRVHDPNTAHSPQCWGGSRFKAFLPGSRRREGREENGFGNPPAKPGKPISSSTSAIAFRPADHRGGGATAQHTGAQEASRRPRWCPTGTAPTTVDSSPVSPTKRCSTGPLGPRGCAASLCPARTVPR